MACQDEKQKQVQGKGEEPREEEKGAPESAVWDLPNSVMCSMPLPPPPGTPNNVMREMLDPQFSSAETDRLSAGLSSGTPNSVMREMDSHVSYGRGGFNRIASGHELVHTIRQGAVSGHISRSVPSDTVQRFGERFLNWIRRRRNRPDGLDGLEEDPQDAAPAGHAADAAADIPPAPAPVRDAAPAPAARDAAGDPAGRVRAPVRHGARGAAGRRALPQKSQEELLDILQQIQRYLPAKQRELAQILTEIQPVPQVLQEPGKLHQMLANDPDKLQQLLENQMHHETEKLKSQKPGLGQLDTLPEIRQQYVDENEQRIRRLQTLQEFRHQDQPELQITQKINELRDEIQEILDGVQQQLPNANLQTGAVDALYRRAKAVQNQIKQLRTDKESLLDKRQALQQENQDYLTRLQADLPDPKSVFKLKDNGEGEYRFRMASDLVDIPGMTKYYIAWCDIHGRNLGAQGDIMAPVQGGLAAAQDAILRQDRSARDAQALGGIGTAGQQTEGNGYHAPNSTVEGHKRRIGTADAVRNSLVLVNAGGKFGVLMDHEKFHGPQPGNDPETGKPYGRWDLANSRGDYRPYTQYVAPIAGGILGGYGGVTAALSAGTSIYDANRKRQNQEVGGSRLDTAQSSLDAGAAILSSASGFWSAADSVASIAGPAANLGGAAVAVPVLSGAAGLINAVSGGMESERARRAEIKIDSAQKELGRLSAGAPAPGPSGGIKSDQQQLEEAMQHTRMVTHLHQRSGGLKAAAGAAQVAAAVSTLAGGAPVAAAFQGTAAILSIAKVAFDRGYKWYMRRKVVGTYYNIDWSQEMDDVREMIKAYNPKFHLRDKDVRAIILRAHGSEEETRTDAFKGINRKRAKYLIDTANDEHSQYHQVAGMVVESMGIHKIGNSFAAGAIDLLAEKLAGA